MDMSDKDKSTPSFILQSAISTGRPRSFSLPDTPLSPVQADRGRLPPSRHAHVVPSLTASNSTAPTTASPETPTDWLKFSSNGFGTVPGSRGLAEKLWDNDVEVTPPPLAPLSRKSSRRAHSRQSRHSRHSSLDSPRTPVAPPSTISAILTSKTTLVTKVKLDEAFIDYWADSVLDPVLKHCPRFVLCQLKSLPPSSTSASPSPTWLVIEQRLVYTAPVARPVMEEAEVTVPPARPRPSSPRPRPESSRLSSAFSIASKRFTFFTGNSDPKSPKEKTARLPLVGEVAKERGDGTTEAAEKSEAAAVKDNVNQGATSAPTTVGATVLAVASTVTAPVAATQDKITQKHNKDDGLPVGTAETTPFEPARVSAPKADESGKDELPHSTATQNGLAHGDEGQNERKSETISAQGPAGADALVSSTVTSELVKAETERLVSGAEVETAQPEPTSVLPYLGGIRGGPLPQVKEVPEPPVVPVVEAATSAEETATAPVIPAPAVSDVPILEEPKSAQLPAAELTPVSMPPAAAIEEPVVDDVAAAQVTEPELVVKIKATEQVPAPSFEAVAASEIPEAALPEGRNGELPTSDAVLVPASEKTVPEEDKSTMREVEVATSADSKPVIVADSSATELETFRTNEVAPAIQTSPVDEGQVADSVDAVETTCLLEEPAEVVGEPDIKEDAQPAAIPQRDASILEESKEIEATATESTTEPHPVASDTAFPAVEKADSAAEHAAPEAPVPNDEPDVEHAVVVAQPVEETLPTHVTQDAVIEEQPTTEEVNPIPEASTSESISAGGPATSHDDETEAAPAESVIAENAPLVEFVEPVTEAVPVTAHDAAHSSANGSAEPVVDHAEQANAEATVLMNGNESTSGLIDEAVTPKGQPGVVAESQATANESESVVPCEEPSASAPGAPVSVVEEPAALEAEIPVETPAPAAHEAESLTEEPAPAATETLILAPEPEPEEPATNEPTAPEVVESAMEAPVSVPAESTPATADSPKANSVPGVEEPTPLLEVVPDTAEAATDPTPLSEESAPITEAAVPETSVPNASGPVVEEDSHVVEVVGPVVEQDGPLLWEEEEDDPTVERDDAVLEEHPPVVEEQPPVVEEQPPIVEEDDPIVERDDPVAEEQAPVVEEQPPIVEEDDPTVERDDPILEEHPPVVEEQPLVEENPPFLEEDSPVVEKDEPAAPERTAENSAALPEDPTSEPAGAVAEETVLDKTGLEETVEVDPVVEEFLPSEEQVAQEPPSASGVDTTTASEPEAPPAPADSKSSETTDAADATD